MAIVIFIMISSLISEIRGETDPGNPVLHRRVNANESSGGPPTNGVISDFHMMDPLLQDHAFQQQILQVTAHQECISLPSSFSYFIIQR